MARDILNKMHNLKNSVNTIFKKQEPEEIIEEKTFEYKVKDIGWDLSTTTKKQKEAPFAKYERFDIYNKEDPIAILKEIPKLSDAEKGVYRAVYDYVKDLPLSNIERDILNYFEEFCEENDIFIEEDQKNYILQLLIYEITGFGPLTTLLQDKDNIEELTIIGTGKENPIYIYISKIGWVKTNLFFTNNEYVQELINRMSRSVGRRLTLNQPLMNAALPDGSRLNAIIPPISNKYPAATLRRFKFNPLTPLDLINYGTFSTDIAAFLWLALQTDSNVLIVGNTGSGKTTTLNAIFSFVPKSERIIVAEETPEINIPHKHKVRLRVDQNLNVTMNDLIVSTLRMRPDRLIVGEIRTEEEVASFLDTILAGQGKGSFATFHGLSARDAVQRLLKLGMLEQDLNALDLIIVQRRWNIYDIEKGTKKEIRKIIDIAEVVDNKLHSVFEFDFKEEKWKFNGSKRMKEKIEVAFNRNFEDLFNEIKQKIEKLIEENKKQRIDFYKFFEIMAMR